MTLVSSVLGVWLSLWACICSCLGLAEEVDDHPSELANVSSAGPNPSKYTTTNLRVTQGSFPWRSAVTADHSYAAEESTISSVWNARRPSYGHCRGDTRRSTSDSASRWLPELSVSSHGSTAPSIPFSLAIRDSSPPSTAHRSGAEDGLDYSQLGALAQRRGFKGSPIIIEPKDWKSSTASNDSYSEPGSLLTSKSLKAKFGNLLRPLPSPLPTTPLSSLFLPISDSIQNSHWDSDPFSMHGESYFAPNTSIDSPNESRLAMYDLSIFEALPAKQIRQGKLPVPSRQHEVTTVNIYDLSIHDFVIPDPSSCPPKKANRKHHAKADSAPVLPCERSVSRDIVSDVNQSERPMSGQDFRRTRRTRRHCMIVSDSDMKRWEVEALV